MKGTYYFNDNGRVSQGHFNDVATFDELMSSFIKGDPFESLLEIPCKTLRYNPSKVSSAFPPSNSWVDETGAVNIEIAATGCTEDDVYVEVEDGQVIVTFQKEPVKEDRIYSQKGLKMVTDQVVKFKFNQLYNDPNKTKVELKNGLLSISIPKREELKIASGSVFGKRKEAPKIEDKSSEEKSE